MSTIPKYSYTLSHSEFYEPMDRFPVDHEAYARGVRSMLPTPWRMFRNGIWYHCQAPDHPLLPQGWKIHLSAVNAGVNATLNAALPVLIRHGCTFKLAADPNILFLLNSKQWHRGGSGKFMTIYPRSTEQFRALLEDLHQATGHLNGPYILSDRRYRDSRCLFYRYGGIAGLTDLTVKGERRAYLVAPDGTRMTDQRSPCYRPHPWAPDPVQEQVAAIPEHDLRTLRDGRYQIQAALHFSNSGGIYLAWDHQDQRQVVIKEARPRTNVDDRGTESVHLLEKEFRLLRKLAKDRIGPEPVELFHEWEHGFLVMEYLEGMTLRQHFIRHNVTRTTAPSLAHAQAFYAAIQPVVLALAGHLERLGRHGIVFRDLSPTNVLILKDGQVRLVDFEAAIELGVDGQNHLFTPGYTVATDQAAPDPADDLYSLGALLFAYLMPVNSLFGLDGTIHERFLAAIGAEYGLPESLLSLISRLMSRQPTERPTASEVNKAIRQPSPIREPQPTAAAPVTREECDGVVDRMANFILSQASFERTDRLFPPDPTVFVTNPLSLAYGACGVAFALHSLQGVVPRKVLDWILAHPVSTADYPPGLYLGMAGIAWTLLNLGEQERALAILSESERHPVAPCCNLFHGLAGWGMAQLRFHQATGDSHHLEQAARAGEQILGASTPSAAGPGLNWPGPDGPRVGLGHGSSGIALFLLYLYLATGEERYLACGQEALAADLSQAVTMDGVLVWPDGKGAERAFVPYFMYGSAGIGSALLRYQRLRPEPSYPGLLEGVKRAVMRHHAIFPQKAFGLAGLGDCLIDFANHGIDEQACLAHAHQVARGILLFGLDRGEGGLAFPGSHLWRISCDYLTGSAGIALYFRRLQTRSAPDFFLDHLFPTIEVRS